jgi:hypothetical protein
MGHMGMSRQEEGDTSVTRLLVQFPPQKKHRVLSQATLIMHLLCLLYSSGLVCSQAQVQMLEPSLAFICEVLSKSQPA